METSLFVTDFSASVRQKEFLTRETGDRDRWQLAEYETTENSGVMLYADNGVMPSAVTVAPGATGWHRIYVCIFSGEAMKCGLSLRLAGDSAPAYFTQGETGNDGRFWFWSSVERGEECFWKAADLTGKSIEVAKIPGRRDARVGLMWLRFVPMTDREVRDHLKDAARRDTRRLHVHTDNDWMAFLPPDASADEYASFIDEWAASDVEIASVETCCQLYDCRTAGKDVEDRLGPCMKAAMAFGRRLPEIIGEYAKRAKKSGMKLYSAQRMGLSNFIAPSNFKLARIPFVSDNPQWQCLDRNGDGLAYLSYAYPEVGDYMIGKFLEAVELGCTGATPIFIRGVQVMFEEPVKRRFAERYPDVDPCTLPLGDRRLAGVRCSFLTDFLRRLRGKFDDYSAAHNIPRLGINPIVCYGLEDSLVYGLDPETWAREGLIDSLVVGNMKLWEEDEHYRDDGNPELISVEKFDRYKKHGERTPVSRVYDSDISLKLPHIREYMDIARSTGVKVYFEMPWEGRCEPRELRDYAMELYRNGAENLSLWDCDVRVIYRPEWQITSKLGHKDELAEMPGEPSGYRRLVRITSLDGVSLASYNPGWRG